MEYAIEWAQGSPEIERIELRVRSANPRALALYQSLGFTVEGELKERIKLTDGYADDVCMGLFVRDAVAPSIER